MGPHPTLGAAVSACTTPPRSAPRSFRSSYQGRGWEHSGGPAETRFVPWLEHAQETSAEAPVALLPPPAKPRVRFAQAPMMKQQGKCAGSTRNLPAGLVGARSESAGEPHAEAIQAACRDRQSHHGPSQRGSKAVNGHPPPEISPQKFSAKSPTSLAEFLRGPLGFSSLLSCVLSMVFSCVLTCLSVVSFGLAYGILSQGSPGALFFFTLGALLVLWAMQL